MPIKIEKPPHGAPCNSCGLCCEYELCPLGERIFQRTAGPCPALELQADGRKTCGLMNTPAKYAWMRAAAVGADKLAAAAAHPAGAGTGCDGRLDGEAMDQAFLKKMYTDAALHPNVSKKALKLWGIE